jgi:hypothetical protein
MPAHDCPRQGRLRLTPRFLTRRWSVRSIAPSMPAHSFSRQGRCRPTWRFCAAGARRLIHVSSMARLARRYGQRLEIAEGTSLRG